MGAEVPARGSLGTALRAQASLVPLRQSHRLSALLGRRKGWGGGASPPFHKEGTGAREVESCSFSGEAHLHPAFLFLILLP